MHCTKISPEFEGEKVKVTAVKKRKKWWIIPIDNAW